MTFVERNKNDIKRLKFKCILNLHNTEQFTICEICDDNLTKESKSYDIQLIWPCYILYIFKDENVHNMY